MARDPKTEFQNIIDQANAIDYMAGFVTKHFEEAPARRARLASQPGFSPADTAQERAELRRLMADHKSDYWRGPNAEQLQQRYRELLETGHT